MNSITTKHWLLVLLMPCALLLGATPPEPISQGQGQAFPELNYIRPVTAKLEAKLSGRATSPGSEIRVEGGLETAFTQATASGFFSVEVSLNPDAVNELSVTEFKTSGEATQPVTISVTQDSSPPALFIDFPTDGAVLNTQTVNVVGRVGDMLTGTMGLFVEVNGQPANVNTGLGNNGTFDFQEFQLPKNQPTSVVVTATDALGASTTKTVTVTYEPLLGAQVVALPEGNNQSGQVDEQLAAPIVVEVLREDGSAWQNKLVTFSVQKSNGRLSANSLEPGEIELQLFTDSFGRAQAFWALGSDAGMGNNRVQVSSMGVPGQALFCASATPAPAAQINIGSGNNQVAIAESPLAAPLEAWVNDSCNGVAGVPVSFTVLQGDGTLSAGNAAPAAQITVVTDSSGHALAELLLGPLSGNQIVEANFPNNKGLPATFVAQALPAGGTSTSLSGVVLDNSQQPLEGVTCSLFVSQDLPVVTTTDDQGQFEFNDLPSFGSAELFVDGSTTTSIGGTPIQPSLVQFPNLEFDLLVLQGAANIMPRPVLLPRLSPNNNRQYDGTQDVVLTVDGIEGLEMTILAGSMTLKDGSVPSSGNPVVVSLNQVHADDVPMPMPDGTTPAFAWTLQPAEARFDPPVQIRYPNMTGLPAGATTYFLSFVHETGAFEIVATGSVEADGNCSVTDPGSGLTLSGWGCQCPPYEPVGECETCDLNVCGLPQPFSPGPGNAQVICVGGATALEGCAGTPSGGTYSWSSSSTKITLAANGATATLTANEASSSLNDIMVSVTYTPPQGSPCTKNFSFTSVEVKVLAADITTNTIEVSLLPAGLTGTLKTFMDSTELATYAQQASGNPTLANAFGDINMLPNNTTFNKAVARYTVMGTECLGELDYKIKVLSVYQNTFYNIPEESATECTGALTPFCYTSGSCAVTSCNWSTNGMAKSGWIAEVLENGSGVSSQLGAITIEGFCTSGQNAPPASCTGAKFRDLNGGTQGCPQCAGLPLTGGSTVARNVNNSDLPCGANVYVHQDPPGLFGGLKQVTDSGGGLSLTQLDHFAGAQGCNVVPGGNAMLKTIRIF